MCRSKLSKAEKGFINMFIQPISVNDILSEQPNISKNELRECIKLSKKSKMLGYATTGMYSASSATMLSTGQTGFMIAGGLCALAALIGLYSSLSMRKLNKAVKEAYNIKYNA